jgi:hypothetical protein
MTKRIEIYRPVVGFADLYLVSNLGRVRNIRKGFKLLKKHPHRDGYRYVYLMICGKKVKRKVYRLVAEAFLGPSPSPSHVVDHKNAKRHDDRLENLQWVTISENNRLSYERGNRKKNFKMKLKAVC